MMRNTESANKTVDRDSDIVGFSQSGYEAISKAKRPKLLFLAWNFPPVHAIASVRTWNVAKYLARLGWDVTVLTPELNVWRSLDDPAKAEAALAAERIRKIPTAHHWRFLSPIHLNCWNQGLGYVASGTCRRLARYMGVDEAIGWVRAAERASASLTQDDVDLILASGPPFSGFVLAERLSRKLDRPYVLDYRDPWTELSHAIRPMRRAVARLEGRLLERSALVTVVSPSWASQLDHRYGVGSKLRVITNGYDPEELSEVKPHKFGHFAVVYTGLFFPPERVVTPVLLALKDIRANGQSPECYFHYYGDHADQVLAEAIKVGVIDRVKLHGRVPRSEALSAIRGANIAVVVASVLEKASTKVSGWVPAKSYEIMGLGTAMLLIAPSGTDVEAIVASSGLAHRFSGTDVAGIRTFIQKEMSGSRIKKGNPERFAWNGGIAEMFDKHLSAVLPHSRSLECRG
jgi:Glycosyltransferase Family 4